MYSSGRNIRLINGKTNRTRDALSALPLRKLQRFQEQGQPGEQVCSDTEPEVIFPTRGFGYISETHLKIVCHLPN